MLRANRSFLGFMRDYWILLVSFFFTSTLFSGIQGFSAGYISSLGASFTVISAISFVSSLVSVVIFPFAGYLGDNWGLKKMFVLGPLVGLLALLVLAFSATWHTVALALVLTAVSTALATPSVLAFIGETATPSRFGIAYGAMFSVLSLCGALGSIIVGYLIAYFGYFSGLRILLFASAFLTLVGIAIRLLIKEKRFPKNTLTDSANIFRRIVSPLQNTQSIAITQAGYMFALGLSSIWFSFFMTDWLGLTSWSMGMVVSISLVAGMISSVFGGFLADRYSKKTIMIVSLLGSAFSTLLLMYSSTFFLVSFSNALLTASSSLFLPVLNAVIASFVSSAKRATAFGMFSSIAYAGSSISVLIGGYMYEHVSLFVSFYLTTFVLLGVSVYVWRMFPKPPIMLPPHPGLVCKTCGYENPEGSQFCGKCGTPLGEEETRIY